MSNVIKKTQYAELRKYLICICFSSLFVESIRCASPRVYRSDGPERRWVRDAKNLVSTLRSASQSLKKINKGIGNWDNVTEDDALYRILSTPTDYLAKAYELTYEIDSSLLELWIVTGHCLYDDILLSDIERSADLICERYINFINVNSAVNRQALVEEGIYKTIELLDSDYCWFALIVIQRHVEFGNHVLITIMSARRGCAVSTQKTIYSAMSDRLSRLGSLVRWNSALGRFTPSDPSRNLMIPKEIIDVIDTEGR